MSYIDDVLERVKKRDPFESEFIQAVTEVFTTISPILDKYPIFRKNRILERIVEPERVIIFKVPWVDDTGKVRVNRGYRVQMNSAIGPYKGGLRFQKGVNLDSFKFLAFEQTFKNALTGYPIGGGKGGSDFDSKDKSDMEVMRFCHAFMDELHRYIGSSIDIPAGDIGVGAREIGYLFGKYKKLTTHFSGVITGKDPKWGGSFIRPEATGFGLVYFAANILAANNMEFKNKTVLVSGAGNVAQFAMKKLIELEAKVIVFSDTSGFIHDPSGVTTEKLEFIMNLKNVTRGKISEYAEKFKNTRYYPNSENVNKWSIPADIALPCAVQNEIALDDAKYLVANKVILVAEGANMPTTNEAIAYLRENGVLFAPGKAANAGGVGISAVEMIQNSMRQTFNPTDVDDILKGFMKKIHDDSLNMANSFNLKNDYVAGANMVAFLKVATSMIEQGVV